MSWPCCPVCKRLTGSGHVNMCPWLDLENQIAELQERVTKLDARADTLLQLIRGLDQRTIGSLQIGGTWPG